MITAKTESGFSIELEESALDNMEVLDALSDLDEGNPLAMSRLVVKLLGKDGKKRLYDHLRTEDGRVPASAVESAIMELFQSINAGKKLCILAELIATDEDALICDFVQYYNLLNWRTLPVRLAATLAAGLPPDSRSMMVLHGQKLTLAQTLQAAELDTLQAICWRIGRLAYADEKPPTSILNTLLGRTEAESEDSPVQYFDSPEEFEAAMRAAEGGEPDGKRH